MTKAIQQPETAADPMPFMILDNRDDLFSIEIEGLGKLELLQRNSLSFNEEEATFTAFQGVDKLVAEGKSVRETNLALYLPFVVMLLRRHDPSISEAIVKERIPTAFWEPCFEFAIRERNGGKDQPKAPAEGKPGKAEENKDELSEKRTVKSSGG